VTAGLEARRNLDRVYAERRDPDRPTHLPEARLVGQRVDVRGGPALSLDDVADLVGHAGDATRLGRGQPIQAAARSALRSPRSAQATNSTPIPASRAKASAASRGHRI